MIHQPVQILDWNGRKVRLTTQRFYGKCIYIAAQVEGSRIKYSGKLPGGQLVNEIVSIVSFGRKTITSYCEDSAHGWSIQVQTNKLLTDKQVSEFLEQLCLRHNFY